MQPHTGLATCVTYTSAKCIEWWLLMWQWPTDSIRLPSSFGWRLIWAACMQVFMYVILNYAKSTKYWTVISQNIKTWTLDTFNWSQWVCVWVIGYFCSIYVCLSWFCVALIICTLGGRSSVCLLWDPCKL